MAAEFALVVAPLLLFRLHLDFDFDLARKVVAGELIAKFRRVSPLARSQSLDLVHEVLLPSRSPSASHKASCTRRRAS